jgi:CDP-glucose 4,6-dehydratase
VLVTGHTGFKGSWLTFLLADLGARVRGYSLRPETSPSIFDALALSELCEHQLSDIRDRSALDSCVADFEPEIVFHLAAQSLVLRSYREPSETLATNVQGTVNLLEACRASDKVRAIVVVTSDKCYLNREWLWPYREDEPLGGDDPYSASKACAELVVHAWQHSFFRESRICLASARAGNIFGGGDWSENRLIPDAVRAFGTGGALVIRRPEAVRPWQHVVNPLAGYLLLAEHLWNKGLAFAKPFNFGPQAENILKVRDLVCLFAKVWGGSINIEENSDPDAPHEATYLTLDSTRARSSLGWQPDEDLTSALTLTAAWYKAFYNKASSSELRRLTRQALLRQSETD